MTVVQANPKIKQKDLAHQTQASNMYGVEEGWTELNPRVEGQAMNLFSSRGMASASNIPAMKVVELQKD